MGLRDVKKLRTTVTEPGNFLVSTHLRKSRMTVTVIQRKRTASSRRLWDLPKSLTVNWFSLNRNNSCQWTNVDELVASRDTIGDVMNGRRYWVNRLLHTLLSLHSGNRFSIE
jgi:hypothetical protein